MFFRCNNISIRWVSAWVSQWLIVSDLEIDIASTKLASLIVIQETNVWFVGSLVLYLRISMFIFSKYWWYQVRKKVIISWDIIFSYASSSTLYLCQWVSESVRGLRACFWCCWAYLGPKHVCFEQPCHWDIFWDRFWSNIWVLKVLIALSSLGGRRPLTGAV